MNEVWFCDNFLLMMFVKLDYSSSSESKRKDIMESILYESCF